MDKHRENKMDTKIHAIYDKDTYWIFLFALTGLLVFSGAASADLITIGQASYAGSNYNLIYEGELGSEGLVWLDYTRGPLPYGTWSNQDSWASGLGFADADISLDPLYMTDIDWGTGWRLPSTDESKANLSGSSGWEGPDVSGYHDYWGGYNMVNSEMGHLYYESLGNKGYLSTNGRKTNNYGLQNTGPFVNLQPYAHWSSEYSPFTGYAWFFCFDVGQQSYQRKEDRIFYALAVRPGQVSAEKPTGLIVNTEKSKVSWDHSEIKLDGKLYFPEGVWMDDLSPVGSAVITLAGVEVADQGVEFDIKGKKDDKWEYKDKENLYGNIKKFKIDWKGAKEGYAKFKLKSIFDPVLFPDGTNTLPDTLEYTITLGESTNLISGSDTIDSWEKKDDRHWKNK